MKTILITAALAAFAFLPATAQDEKKELTPAETLLKATRFESAGIDAAISAFRPVINQFKAEGIPAAGIKEIEDAAAAYFHQVMSDPNLKNGVLNLYNQVFTQDELVELIEFYKTPIGQKALIQMPQILGEAMQLGQTHAEKYAPQFQAQLEKILAKYQDQKDGGAEKPKE